jgi:hypothetical protein
MPFFQRKPASEIKKLADNLRPRSVPGTYLLPKPSENYLALNGSRPEDIKDVVDWLIFNPYGPTLFTLALINSPLTNESFIFSNTDNPFGSTRKIYGLIPGILIQNQPKLAEILNALFNKYGSEIIGSYPSSVRLLPGSPLEPVYIKKMFIQALLASPPDNLDHICEQLSTYNGDPWKRASAELADARATLLTGKELPKAPLTSVNLEKWWDLVTDPYHVKVEAQQMPIAWKGALTHVNPL